MRNISGWPVEGDNFFGRESELGFLKETLDCQDVLLLGSLAGTLDIATPIWVSRGRSAFALSDKGYTLGLIHERWDLFPHTPPEGNEASVGNAA